MILFIVAAVLTAEAALVVRAYGRERAWERGSAGWFWTWVPARLAIIGVLVWQGIAPTR